MAKEILWKKARKKPIVVEFREIDREIKIVTREGILKAYPQTDYLIRGIDGEVYPIKKSIFEKTYEVL